MVPMWKLSSYGRNIEIKDGRHIIRHAVFKERQMSLTSVFYISISFWFRWQPYSLFAGPMCPVLDPAMVTTVNFFHGNEFYTARRAKLAWLLLARH